MKHRVLVHPTICTSVTSSLCGYQLITNYICMLWCFSFETGSMPLRFDSLETGSMPLSFDSLETGSMPLSFDSLETGSMPLSFDSLETGSMPLSFVCSIVFAKGCNSQFIYWLPLLADETETI